MLRVCILSILLFLTPLLGDEKQETKNTLSPFKNLESPFEYEVAICAIFQNEGRFMQEWLEYHLLIGVEHFYLYDNLSSDEGREILAPYISAGIVDLYTINKQSANLEEFLSLQANCYNKTLDEIRGRVHWLCFLDLDEFVLPVKDRDLPTCLKRYEKYGGVGVNWQIFGNSGIYLLKEGQLQTEHFIYKAKKKFEGHSHVKSIVQPNRVEACISPHYCKYRDGYYQVNVKKKSFRGPWTAKPSVGLSTLQINHYFSRDEHFFRHTKIARQILYYNTPELYTEEWIHDHLHSYNQVKDTKIHKFVPDLKEKWGQALLRKRT